MAWSDPGRQSVFRLSVVQLPQAIRTGAPSVPRPSRPMDKFGLPPAIPEAVARLRSVRDSALILTLSSRIHHVRGLEAGRAFGARVASSWAEPSQTAYTIPSCSGLIERRSRRDSWRMSHCYMATT